MIKLDYTRDLGENNDTRLIVVNKYSGKIDYTVLRCLHNFQDDSIVVGMVLSEIVNDELISETFSLFHTENNPAEYFSILFKNINYENRIIPDREKGTFISHNDIDKLILSRAKDILFSFKER